jgi:hypothetical protein
VTDTPRLDAWRAGLVVVFVLAFAVRLAPLVRTGSLTGYLRPEDGTAYSASAHLLHGLLPYRDVLLGQPPGLAVLMLPFTALAPLLGDPGAMAAARVAVALLGALNAVLIALFLRRYALAWALAGGLLYAVWRLPAEAERTVTFEAFLATGLLGALVLLGPEPGLLRPRRVAASGALMGLAVAVTLWAGPAALLIAGYLLATRAVRTAAVWVGGAVAGFAVLAGPWVIAAPSAFLGQAVQGHLQVTGDATASGRLRRFIDLVRLGGYALPENIEIMIATCVIVALGALALTAWWQPEARLPVLLLALQTALVTTAPDHDDARFAAAPTLVVVAVTALHRLLPAPRAGVPRRVAVAVGIPLLAGLALTAVHNVVPRPPDPAALRAFAASHGCVWFDTASHAVEADAVSSQLARGCPAPVDRTAELRSVDVSASGDPQRAGRRSPAYQRHLQAQLAAADAAVVPDDHDAGILSEDALEALDQRFARAGEYDGHTMWVRRR